MRQSAPARPRGVSNSLGIVGLLVSSVAFSWIAPGVEAQVTEGTSSSEEVEGSEPKEAAEASPSTRREELQAEQSRLREELANQHLIAEQGGALSDSEAKRIRLAELDSTLGSYQDLIDRLEAELEVTDSPSEEAAEAPPRVQIELERRLAQAYRAIGEDARALTIFQRLARHAGDLPSRFEVGRLLAERGDLESAEQWYYGLIRAYNTRPRLTAAELVAVAEACRELGRDNPQLFKDALKAFDLAIARGGDPSAEVRARVLLTELFVSKYDSTQAREALDPLISAENPSPEVLLAAARVEHFDGRPTSKDLAHAVLEINPGAVDALVFLAKLENEAEDRDSAASFTERALAVNPRSLPAMTLDAGLRFLRDDTEGFEAVQSRVLAQNPRYAEFYVELSLMAMRNRLYPAALDFAQRAVAIDEKSWAGWGELGLNQLRLGYMEQGRDSLEKAFAGDPYNVWIKNTLDLLDELDGFETLQTEHFLIVLDPEEAELLGPMVADIAERSYASLAERYDYEPATPIRLEVFPRHEDFSVRTVGLSGLGALGVCFGPVIAMDSPSARGIGDFNWGTTLWHEIAHTFTLGITNGRIPRWLTEGLSVYEERQGPKGWTDEPPPDFLAAYADGRLLGLREMNDGFMRPSFPNQIGLSYYQASLVAEYIDKTWGFASIVSILEGYGRGLDTEEVFTEQFELSLEDFDEQFWDFLEERFASALPTFREQNPTVNAVGEIAGIVGESELERLVGPESEKEQEETLQESPQAIELPSGPESMRETAARRPNDFRVQLAYGQELVTAERWDEANEVLARARDLFPEFAGPGSPYHLLAEVAVSRGDDEAAAVHLQALVDVNEYDFESHLELGRVYERLGRESEELETLGRTIFIYPFDPRVHERMGTLAKTLDPEQRIRSLRAVLALRPSGRPRLLYEIAQAQRDLGRIEDAKRSVLGALEVAPSYQAAQELLLELVSGDGADS